MNDTQEAAASSDQRFDVAHRGHVESVDGVSSVEATGAEPGSTRPSLLGALPTTAFIFAVQTSIAAVVGMVFTGALDEASGILGARALHSADGAHLVETIWRLLNRAAVPGGALLGGWIVTWMLSPWLLMTWLAAITRAETTWQAARSGWKHLPRTLWLRVVLLVPQAALLFCWLLIVGFVHVATQRGPDAFGAPLAAAVVFGLFPYGVHRVISDGSHAALASGRGDTVQQAIGYGIRRLGLSTLLLWGVLALGGVALHASVTLGMGAQHGAWTLAIATQAAVVCRWLMRGWWLSSIAPR